MALWAARRAGELDVVGLLTTVTSSFGRVSMHGVREELLEEQAEAAGLSLRRVEIPFPCTNARYDRAMREAVDAMRSEGVTRLVFGDVFLQDVRRYREDRLEGTGLTPVFPLWGRDTTDLAREIVRSGVEARIVCLDPRRLPRSFAGRSFDAALLAELPSSVDPCGERGEFHTFVTAGPMLSHPIAVRVGETVERDRFVFTDLRPARGTTFFRTTPSA